MNFNEIAGLRLLSQQLEFQKFTNPEEVIKWMGAVQAQDFPMSKWAVGLRFPNPSVGKIDEAIDCGKIIRTHVLRPTWHLIPAEDIEWMRKLTSGRIQSSMKSRNKQLELTGELFKKTNRLLEINLTEQENLSREQIEKLLNEAGIRTNDNRLSHILMNAELEGIICSGKTEKNRHTYSLIAKRVKKLKKYSKEEALTELAVRYFQSHFPATLKDFAWWSGLTFTEAKKGFENIKPEFSSMIINSKEYLTGNSSGSGNSGNSVHLLPAYDEFLISYSDRSASLNSVKQDKAVSNNGIFYPVIIENGIVKGKWKRITVKNKIVIEFDIFEKQGSDLIKKIRKKAELFGSFLNKKIEIKE